MRGENANQRHLLYFFIILFVAILYISFLIIKPFITAIVSAMVLVYIFHPLYRGMNRIVRNKSVSAIVTSILIIIIILIPMLFIANTALEESKQLRYFYVIAKQKISTGIIPGAECQDNSELSCMLSGRVRNILATPDFRAYMESAVLKGASFFVDTVSSFLLSIPFIILNLFIIMFLTYYLLKEGKDLADQVKKMLPLRPHHQTEIMARFNETTYALIFGQIMIAILQGVIASVTFAIAGVSPPLLWGFVVAILALIPIVGASLIWIPAMLIKFFAHNPAHALIILAFGLLISTIDTFIKPKVIGTRSKVHPAIILLGVIGGLKFFGIIGFIIGPIILTLFITFIRIYEREKSEIPG